MTKNGIMPRLRRLLTGRNPMDHIKELEKKKKRNAVIVFAMLAAVAVTGLGCLFVGSSDMTFGHALDALLGGGSDAQWNG